MKPLVSVIMPIWTAEPRPLEAALASVLGQTHTKLELLVVEDRSERPAADVLRACGDERVRHVVQDEKSSMAAARNRGLALARGTFVAMHDGDDVSDARRIEEQLRLLESRPDVDIVGTSIHIVDEVGRRTGARAYPQTHEAILEALPRFNPIAHPTVMFRKDVVESAGGYDESAARVCEDYELWSRLAHRGARFFNLEERLLEYRLHASASKRTRLRATPADTLAIKDRYWREARTLRDRARIGVERGLLHLPPRFVYWLFRKTQLQPW